MNLTATLCQTRSPAFFTFYKQNNNKIEKKAGDRVWQSIAVKFISLDINIFTYTKNVVKLQLYENKNAPSKIFPFIVGDQHTKTLLENFFVLLYHIVGQRCPIFLIILPLIHQRGLAIMDLDF